MNKDSQCIIVILITYNAENGNEIPMKICLRSKPLRRCCMRTIAVTHPCYYLSIPQYESATCNILQPFPVLDSSNQQRDGRPIKKKILFLTPPPPAIIPQNLKHLHRPQLTQISPAHYPPPITHFHATRNPYEGWRRRGLRNASPPISFLSISTCP